MCVCVCVCVCVGVFFVYMCECVCMCGSTCGWVGVPYVLGFKYSKYFLSLSVVIITRFPPEPVYPPGLLGGFLGGASLLAVLGLLIVFIFFCYCLN